MVIQKYLQMIMKMTLMMNTRDTNQLNIKEYIYQIVYLIRSSNDYKSASEIMIKNNLSIDQVSENTYKLTDADIAKLADKLIENKI